MASQQEIDQLNELNTLLKMFDVQDRVYIFRIGGGSYFYSGKDNDMCMCSSVEELKVKVHEAIRKHKGA